MALELAAEATYPMDASISESWVHVNVQISSIILVLTGNELFWDLPDGFTGTCKEIEDVGEGGVEARDYTPYSYMLMAQTVVSTIVVIFFVKAELLRSAQDHKRQKPNERQVVVNDSDWTAL